MKNKILRDLIDQGVVVYIDKIVIYIETIEEYILLIKEEYILLIKEELKRP
jgi:hypothetical protein